MRPYPRSAHASIRGYLYQCCLGVLRWLELGEDEAIVFEGDEDVDRLIRDGIGISEQVKALERAANLRDRVVLDSLRGFLLTYHALRQAGEERRFVFTTTAEPRAQRTADLGVDILEAWKDREQRPAILAALQKLLPLSKDEKPAVRRKAIATALAWMEKAEERWNAFVDAVEWRFNAPDVAGVRGEVASRLAARAHAVGLPREALIDRLVAEVFDRSSRKDPVERTRTAADLTALLGRIGGELVAWTAGPGLRLRHVFQDLDDLRFLLEPPTRPKDDFTHNPGKVLRAAYEVIPFEEESRRELLGALAGWCAQPDPRGVFLLTGEGGTGKTRLSIEWCRRLEHQGWLVGFLAAMRDGHEPDTRKLFQGATPRLVVVDYAETRLDLVRSLLRDLALHTGSPKVRVVLIARNEADWWSSLVEDDDIEDLLAAAMVRRIEPLTRQGESREEAFQRALEALGQRLGRTVPADGWPDLAEPEYDRALYFYMAAFALLHGVPVHGAAEALAWTLKHERRFWKREIEREGLDGPGRRNLEKILPHVLTAVTLLGGCGNRQRAEALAEQTGRAPRMVETLIDLLHRLYAGPDGPDGRFLEGLQPDLLGEELVRETLSEGADLLDVVLQGADPEESRQVLTVLTRLAQRFEPAVEWIDRALTGQLESLAEIAVQVAVATGDPVGQRLALALSREASVEAARKIADLCDQDALKWSVPLRELAYEATRIVLEAPTREENLEERARRLNNLCIRLGELGRREPALEAAQEATDIYRRLAEQRSDAFLPHLAMSLNNLGKMLSDLGRREPALEAAQEATDIYRRLAEQRPDAFLPYLASSLNNLGTALSDLGRREPALEAAQEATDIYRRLAEQRPDVFLPYLASSLNNLGNRLSDLGRREPALEAAQEATDIYRRLAQQRPDAFLPHLAMSLNNLGNWLSVLGRLEQALEATKEATNLYRSLTQYRLILLHVSTTLEFDLVSWVSWNRHWKLQDRLPISAGTLHSATRTLS